MSNYELKRLVYGDSVHGGTGSIKLSTDETKYTNSFPITHHDSVHGILIEIAGTRYGSAVNLQMQQAPKPLGPWSDVLNVITLGSGGSEETPAALDQVNFLTPPSGVTFYPYMRMKFSISDAGTSATLTDIYRTMRGLK